MSLCSCCKKETTCIHSLPDGTKRFYCPNCEKYEDEIGEKK